MWLLSFLSSRTKTRNQGIYIEVIDFYSYQVVYKGLRFLVGRPENFHFWSPDGRWRQSPLKFRILNSVFFILNLNPWFMGHEVTFVEIWANSALKKPTRKRYLMIWKRGPNPEYRLFRSRNRMLRIRSWCQVLWKNTTTRIKWNRRKWVWLQFDDIFNDA